MRPGPVDVAVLVSVSGDPLARAGLRSAWLRRPAGLTLADAAAFARAELGLPDGPACLVVNGRAVEDGAYVLADGDDVRLCPRPGSPVDAVLLAIAIASAALSASLVGRIKPGKLSTSDEPEARRFGFTRFSNDAVVGDTIPVVFGRRRRWGGKVIAKVPKESADGTGESSIRMLLCLGHGPFNRIGSRTADFDRVAASAVEGIYLNDQPIGNFPGVRLSGRLGTPGQSVIPGFGDVELLREVGVGGITLRNTSGSDRTDPSASAEAVLVTTTSSVDAVVARVRFPDGLYSVGSGNQLDVRRVQYRSRHRVTAGPGAWSAWTVWTLERADQGEFFSSPRLDALGGVQRDVQLERVTAEPAPGTFTVSDRMVFDSVVEVTYSANTYAGLALLAVELVASEQLTSVPRVSADVEGLKSLRVWDGVSSPSSPVFNTAYSANPAWQALELLTNEDWGIGVTYGDDRIDLASLFAWAQYCDEAVPTAGAGTRPRFRCDLALDTERSPIEWLRVICGTGRCLPVTSGGLWRFVVDRPQATPVEVFGDGSIAVGEDGAARIEYVREHAEGGVVRPNRLLCQFESAEQEGEPELLAYPELGEAWLATEPVLEETIKLEGVTGVDQAWAELLYRMGKVRFQTRSVEFVTTRPAVAVQPGDRFDLAASLVGWGLASGRLRAGATASTIILDRTVTLEAGVDYVVSVLFDSGSTETRALAVSPGTYAAGEVLSLASPLSAAPPEFAEYVVGRSEVHVKPFLCTGVSLEDGAGLLWRVRGVEYVEGIYEGDPATIQLPNYSSLNSPSKPPGPLAELTVREIRGESTLYVELAWRQEVQDEENTATFRVYRRKVGTQTWVLIPGLTPGRRAVVVELTGTDLAYEFVVVAVSIGGAFLSPYDPRHPIARLVFGLLIPPPPPPSNLVAVQEAGNTYRLEWDPVDDAVEYQVLTGGDSTSLPNAGAEDCLVLARTIETFLGGLELTPGVSRTFWVRSVGANGRLSFTASEVTVADPDLPAGESVKDDSDLDLEATGTASGLTYNSGAGRLELSSPGSAGSWTSDEVDTGALTLTELTFRAGTANDADDPAVASDPFKVPSIAADQWGVVDGGPPLAVGMLMPPWPDDEQSWVFEVRTHDGVGWSAWEALGPCASVRRTFQKYQLKATLDRDDAPYRPALRALRVVCTD